MRVLPLPLSQHPELCLCLCSPSSTRPLVCVCPFCEQIPNAVPPSEGKEKNHQKPCVVCRCSPQHNKCPMPLPTTIKPIISRIWAVTFDRPDRSAAEGTGNHPIAPNKNHGQKLRIFALTGLSNSDRRERSALEQELFSFGLLPLFFRAVPSRARPLIACWATTEKETPN